MKTKRRTIHNSRSHKKAGKVIGTGSYGCVFSPPLKCKNVSSRPNQDTTVTKLMETDDAFQEEKEIAKVLSRIDKIPDYTKYTLISDVYSCEPDVDDITADDMSGKSCPRVMSLKNGGYDDDEIRLLQIPKGGREVETYFRHQDYKDKTGLNEFIIGMHDLLVDFIVPMNDKGVYHQDIKSDNVLVNDNNQAQLIDWGFLVVNKHGDKPIEVIDDGDNNGNTLFRRFIMFNQPLSAVFTLNQSDYDNPDAAILPNGLFKLYKNGKLNRTNAISKLHSYLKSISDEYGLPGHYEFARMYLQDAIETLQNSGKLSKKNDSGETITNKTVISDYLLKLFDVYGKSDDSFDVGALVKDFHHNVDPWGWVMCMAPIMEITTTGALTKEIDTLKENISQMILYLYTDGAIRINTDTLANMLVNGIQDLISPYNSSSGSQDTVIHHESDSSKSIGGTRKRRVYVDKNTRRIKVKSSHRRKTTRKHKPKTKRYRHH